MDALLHFVVGNLLVAVPLGLVALFVQRGQRFPAVAHVLWLLVLVKLITPPLLNLPLVPIPIADSSATTQTAEAFPFALPSLGEAKLQRLDKTEVDASEVDLVVPETSESQWAQTGLVICLVMWLAGSTVVLFRSLVPIVRFHRLIRGASQPAGPSLQNVARGTAQRLGMQTCPSIETIPAQVAPLVWCFAGRVRVVLPEALADELDVRDLQMVLAHELAHIKRRDHLVRWIEWIACVCFWWNPITWWARRNLRFNEEMCCDAMVLQALGPAPRAYAGSLLTVLEFLTTPAIRPPAMACAFDGGGTLKRRLGMIMSQKTQATPKWLMASVVALSLGLVPLGVAYGQDFDAVGERLREAVAQGELSKDQARVMMDALRHSSGENEPFRRIREIEEAIESGEISREDGARAIEETKRSMKDGHIRDRGEEREAYEGRVRKIETAVKAGKMSREEAARAMKELMKSMKGADRAHDRGDERKAYEARMRKIEAAVKAGKMSREEAAPAMEELMKSMKGADRAHDRGDERKAYEARMRKIEAAVKAGKMSREEAARAMEQLANSMKGADRAHDRGDEREAYEARMRKIEAAVKAGKMSREEAAHAIRELMESMEESDRARDRGDERVSRGDLDLARFSDLFAQAESNFRRAIESGDLSPVEAEALLKDLRIMIRLRPEYHDGHFDDEDFDEFLMEFFEDEQDDGDGDRRER